MNRDQMINHLILTGWVPVGHLDYWVGIGSEASGGLLYVNRRGDTEWAPEYFDHISGYSVTAANFEISWDRLSDIALQQLSDYIAEKGLI